MKNTKTSNDRFQTFCKTLKSIYQRHNHYIPILCKEKIDLDYIYLKQDGSVKLKRKNNWCDDIIMKDIQPHSVVDLLLAVETLEKPVIAIEGKVGTGKTTLCKMILKEWACNKLTAINNNCLLYLNINDKQRTGISDNKYTIESCSMQNDILGMFHLPKRLVDKLPEILQEHDEDVLVLIDIHNIDAYMMVVYQLINKMLPKAKFMLFCRPEISEKLSNIISTKLTLLDLQIDKIEYLIEQLLPNSYMYDEFCDVIEENEDIRTLCGNPFICTALVSMYKTYKNMNFIENKIKLTRQVIKILWDRYM